MKAFLSHSSKDKATVRDVAKFLGEARCAFDEYTFEYDLTQRTIRRALSQCELFVLFLSEHSIKSNFVADELKTAFEFRGRGSLQRILIIALDSISYKLLPDWLQDYNVAHKLHNANAIARKIEGVLLSLDISRGDAPSVIIPREDQERRLRADLSKPTGAAPIALHVVGHYGVGRRTFIQDALSRMYNRISFIPISFDRFEGPNEFYRKVYDHVSTSSTEQKLIDFDKFSTASNNSQIEILVDMMAGVSLQEEILLVDDRGGVYTDDGDYQPFLIPLINELKGSPRPLFVFVQTRMMPTRIRVDRLTSSHVMIYPFDEARTAELLSFILKNAEIQFSGQQLSDLCSLMDGVPINIKLTLKVIESNGLDIFLDDPSILIEWKRHRAEDFLTKVIFTNVEAEIMAVFYEYRYLHFETLKSIIDSDTVVFANALRKLEEFCCLERRDGLYAVSQPLHDAIGRDKRFQRGEAWRRSVAAKILDLVETYQEDERTPVALMEAAVIAQAVSDKSQVLVSRFILPSYYLSLANRSYIDGRWGRARDFCKMAWERRAQLSIEGKIEALRLWGLAGIRLEDAETLDFCLGELMNLKAIKTARRHLAFLRGFKLRRKKQYDEAEQEFLKAYRLAPRSVSVNRELANLYRHQRDFVEGERYARAAHQLQPANPFIIDVLLECLLGRASLNMDVNQDEIELLLSELQRYGDVPGSSFYQTRIA